MKKIVRSFFAFLLLFTIMSPTAYALPDVPETVSEAYIVMDAQTGQVLIEKNSEKREFPASITKILTVAMGLEKNKLSDVHSMSQEAVFSIEYGSSHIALTMDEEVTMEQLAYATIMMSANDAANGIAEMTGGSLDEFTVMMNEKLKELGAENTHFVNAHGLHDDAHYTTAYDMALITKYALTVPNFREFFGKDSYTHGSHQ